MPVLVSRSALMIDRPSGASGTGISVRCSRNCRSRTHSNELRATGPSPVAPDGAGWRPGNWASTTHSPMKTSRRASASALVPVTSITPLSGNGVRSSRRYDGDERAKSSPAMDARLSASLAAARTGYLGPDAFHDLVGLVLGDLDELVV